MTATKNQNLQVYIKKTDTKQEINDPYCSQEISHRKACMTDHTYTCKKRDLLYPVPIITKW